MRAVWMRRTFTNVCLEGTGLGITKSLGTVWGWGQLSIWEFFGDQPQKTPKFGDGDEGRHCQTFGDSLGMGTVKILGIFEGKSPKNLKNRGGVGG